MDEQTIETPSEDLNFDDFFDAFDNETDNQDDPGEEGEETAEDDTAEEDQEGQDGEDSESAESEPVKEEKSAEGSEKPGEPTAEQTFTIKVNKETRTVSREEMIALAQQGADYGRVKEQLTQSRQSEQALRQQLDGQSGIMELLDLVSKKKNMPPQELVENLYINMLRMDGMDETAARESLRADKLQRKIDTMNSQKAQQEKVQSAEDQKAQRIKNEVDEFRREFPGVEIDETLASKLMADVQSGMSLANAYRKMESARKDARIAELENQLAAEKQNKKNRRSSPGSQNDAGGRNKRDEFDDFLEAFG